MSPACFDVFHSRLTSTQFSVIASKNHSRNSAAQRRMSRAPYNDLASGVSEEAETFVPVEANEDATEAPE